MKISGIIPPLVTPFHEDGRLDLASFEANLGFYSGQDLSGYLVLGSNGEAASLEDDEKLALVGCARRLCPPSACCSWAAASSRRPPRSR